MNKTTDIEDLLVALLLLCKSLSQPTKKSGVAIPFMAANKATVKQNWICMEQNTKTLRKKVHSGDLKKKTTLKYSFKKNCQ